MELINHFPRTWFCYLFHSKIDNGLEGPCGNKYFFKLTEAKKSLLRTMGFQVFFLSPWKKVVREICLRWLKWRSKEWQQSRVWSTLFVGGMHIDSVRLPVMILLLSLKNPWREENWYLPYMPYMLTTNSTVSIGIRRTFRVPFNVVSCTARSSSIVAVPVC